MKCLHKGAHQTHPCAYSHPPHHEHPFALVRPPAPHAFRSAHSAFVCIVRGSIKSTLLHHTEIHHTDTPDAASPTFLVLPTMLLFHLAKHPYRSILAFRYYHFLNGSEDRNMWHEAPRRFYEFIHAFKTSAINPFSP
jgi:hypothetical protein